MANDLVDPSDLVGLPGAPFSVTEVDAAVAALRGIAGWHIAPVMTETVSLDVIPGDPVLRLPTRKLNSVTAVRDTDGPKTFAATSYRVSHGQARVRRKGGFWPSGYERVEVDMVHGYDELPAELLAVVAQLAGMARRDPTIQSLRVDDASVSYLTAGVATAAGAVSGAVPAAYVLPKWSGMA